MVASNPKQPIQLRLDDNDLGMLDSYIARFAEYPPTRVSVLHRAVREWLQQQLVAGSGPGAARVPTVHDPDRGAGAPPQGVPTGLIAKRPAPPEDTPGLAMGEGSPPVVDDDEKTRLKKERLARNAQAYRQRKKAAQGKATG
jgi:hypothetical protein